METSGPLCGMPDDATLNIQVATNVAPAGERQNRTPFSSYVSRTSAASFRGYGPRVRVGFQPRLKGRSRCLSHKPPTASQPVSALRSLDGARDSLDAQFHRVNDPSVPTVTEVVQAHSFAPASEPKLTNPTEPQDAIRGPKLGKAPCPDGIPYLALKHLPLSVVSLLILVFNFIFRTQCFPMAWKHAPVF
jgi:hypothetical protein